MSTGSRLMSLFMVVALLIGAALADVYLVRRALLEHASGTAWRATTGTISSVAVTSRKTKSGRRYRPAVTYEYQADGRTWVSTAVVVGERTGPSFSSEAAARKAFAPGARVPVYFDPTNPSNAALVVGLRKQTLVLLYLAGLLNAVAVALLRCSIRSLAFRNDPVRYYIVVDEPPRAVLRLSHLTALECGVLWAGMGSAAAGLVLAVVSPMSVPWIGVPVAAGLGVAGLVWRASSLRAGRHDVVVDRASGFVTLPARPGVVENRVLDMAMIDAVEVRQAALPSAKKNTPPMADVWLHPAESDEPRLVARWLAREEAEAIATWLRGECALEDKD